MIRGKVIGLDMDITEKKILEQEAEKSYQMLHKLTDNVPGAIYQYRLYPDGRMTFPYVSSGSKDIWEVTSDDVLNDATSAFNRIHPDDLEKVASTIEDSANSMTDWNLEYRVNLPKKGLRWLSGHAKPEKLKDGSILWHGYIHDVTEEKIKEDNLLISNKRFEHAEHAGNVGSWEYDIDTQSYSASIQAKTIFGIPKEAITYSAELIDSCIVEKKRVHQALVDLIDKGTEYDLEYEINPFDGSNSKIISSIATIEFDGAKKPLKVSGFIQDITEKQANLKTLKQKKQELESMIINAPTPMILHEEGGKILMLNQAWINASGFSLEDTPTIDDWVEHTHDDDEESIIAFKKHIHSLYEITEKVDEGEFTFLNKYNDSLTWQVSSSPLGIIDGKRTIITSAMDITERSKLQKELEVEKNRFALAVEGSQDGLWDWNLQTDELLFGERYEVMLGYTPGTFEKSINTWFNLLHPDDLERENKAVQEYLDKKGDDFYETIFRFLAKDGSWKWILGRGKAEFAEDGTPIRFVGFNTDITEQKEHQNKLQLANIELAFQNKEKDKRADELDFANIEKEKRADELALANIELAFQNKEKDKRADELVLANEEKENRVNELALAAKVFTHAREGIMITDAKGNIIEVNDTFSSISGYSRKDVMGQNLRMLESGQQSPKFYADIWENLLKEGYWSGEICNRRKNGEQYIVMQTISAVRDVQGIVTHYVSLSNDITLMKAHQDQLEHIAHYDILTNLPNRVLLSDRLSQAMLHSNRNEQSLAVVFLDLDGFKAVNDAYGHDVGDELLIVLSVRMKEALRECDSLARIGGDEFVAVLADLDNIEDCKPVLERLLLAASEPITVSEIVLNVSASIGVTLYPQDGADTDQLMRHADQAMYAAKESGKNCYYLFDTAQDDAVKLKRESLEAIRMALDNHQFVLYYQPKVNMRTGMVTGFEALIRWQHPKRGLLNPIDFLPVIENNPMSIEMGEWVIDTALTQISQWQAMGLKHPVSTSVNIAAVQLQRPDFTDRLTTLLAAHPDVEPRYLELEVLETTAIDDVHHVSTIMNACITLGVNFALDDFGTGYSSLTHLRRLPASLIKIDQTFVRDMLDDADDLAIVEGVIALAKSFKRDVIAEGVETIEHGTALLQLGCDLAQGYGIARPMPASDIPTWVNDWKPDASWQI